jgi:hypothetical protein
MEGKTIETIFVTKVSWVNFKIFLPVAEMPDKWQGEGGAA